MSSSNGGYDYNNDAGVILQVRDKLAYIGKGVAVLDDASMAYLELNNEEVISIFSKNGRALARCVGLREIYRHTNSSIKLGEKGVIELDAVIRENAGVKVGDFVLAKKAAYGDIPFADEVEVVAIKEELDSVDGALLSRWQSNVPLMKGNLVLYYEWVRKAKDYFGSLFRITKTIPASDNGVIVKTDGQTKFIIKR